MEPESGLAVYVLSVWGRTRPPSRSRYHVWLAWEDLGSWRRGAVNWLPNWGHLAGRSCRLTLLSGAELVSDWMEPESECALLRHAPEQSGA